MKQLILPILLVFTFNNFARGLLVNFEFNKNFTNASNRITAVVNGATLTTDRHGSTDNAYYFDGIDDYLEIPTGLLNVKNNQSFTMETYVYIEKTQGFWGKNNERSYTGGALFSLYGAPSLSNDLFLVWYQEGQLISSHRTQQTANGSQQRIVQSIPDLYNKYHHIVIVRDGKKQIMTLYVDGKKINEVDIKPASKIGKYPAYIGKHNDILLESDGSIKSYGTHFFKGKMDYLKIYKSALSERQIKRKYNRASTAPYKCDYYTKNDNQKQRYDNEYKIDRDLSIYPNPTRNNINIRANSDMDCREIRIINHCGQIVLRSTFKNHLHTGCLRPGYYTVVFLTPTKNYHRRLIVVR